MRPMPTPFRYHQMLVSAQVGGAAKLAMQMQSFVVARRGRVSRMLVPGGGDAERDVRRQQFDYTNYDHDGLVSSSRLTSLRANIGLYRRMRRHQGGILHIHSPFVFGAARPFLHVARLKTVLHIHLDYTEEQLRWPLQIAPSLILLSAKSIRPPVDAALAASGGRSRMRVLQNAVDGTIFHPGDRTQAKVRYGLDPSAPLIVIIANLAPHKGQETAIRALSAVGEQYPNARLWVVGEDRQKDQQYRGRLEDLVRGLGVQSQVSFLGFRDDIPEILRAADFLLLPSTSETLSLVILEAQASRAVVLAAPTADIPEVVIDGQSGYLVAADDVASYAARLRELIAKPELAAALADNAFQRVHERHQLKHYCQAVLDEYDQLETEHA